MKKKDNHQRCDRGWNPGRLRDRPALYHVALKAGVYRKASKSVSYTYHYYICAPVVSYVAFVLPLFVLHLSFFSSAKCSTKPLFLILTRILTAVKRGLQKYCDIAYARRGVNQIWILKNSKELLENLKTQYLHTVNSIKSFDFSTLYNTIPHDKLKSKLKEIINQCFFHKNGNRQF